MSFFEGLSLFGLMVILALLPSASVALVVTRSVAYGMRNGVAVAFGIVLGDLIFVGLAIAGMGVLAQTYGTIFSFIRIIGGAYLMWLGLKLITAKNPSLAAEANSNSASLFTGFTMGLLLTLGDLKAILFYASLLPNFMNLAETTTASVVALVAITATAVGAPKIGYAMMAQRFSVKLQRRCAPALKKLAGLALLGAGALFIFSG